MNRDELPPRERILEATINCIEREGLNNLTTRRIAEEAGANIAAINYYFRSKDALVAEALDLTLKHMMGDVFAYLDDPEKPFYDILEEVFFYLIDGGQRFPGIIMAHIYGALVEKRPGTPVMKVFQQLSERLVARAAQEYPRRAPEALRTGLAEIMAAVIFSSLVPEFFRVQAELDLSQPDATRRMAKYMVALFEKSIELAGF